MHIDPSHGYDQLVNYSVNELVSMYQAEGVPSSEATGRAKIVRKEITRMNREEQRLWQRVRANEQHFREPNPKRRGY